MTFPDAYFGVKKIYTAQILEIIATVALCISGIAAAIAVVSIGGQSAGGFIGGGIAMIIFGLGAAILGLIATILTIVGLSRGSRDNEDFKTGMILAFIVLGLTILQGILSSIIGTSIYDDLTSSIADLLNIGVTLFIIRGICTMATKVGDVAMEERGRKLYILFAIIMLVSIILRFVGALVGRNAVVATGASILAILSAIASIVGLILYLGYLKKAQTMLYTK